MISFDTDMIGPYGYCADLLRSRACDDAPMNNVQRQLYETALAQIAHNTVLLQPGLSFAEFNAKSWQILKKHQPYRYLLALHGVGMADEWPVVALHTDFGKRSHDGHSRKTW